MKIQKGDKIWVGTYDNIKGRATMDEPTLARVLDVRGDELEIQYTDRPHLGTTTINTNEIPVRKTKESVMKRKSRQQESEPITVEEEVLIPGTDIILEKGDRFEVVKGNRKTERQNSPHRRQFTESHENEIGMMLADMFREEDDLEYIAEDIVGGLQMAAQRIAPDMWEDLLIMINGKME